MHSFLVHIAFIYPSIYFALSVGKLFPRLLNKQRTKVWCLRCTREDAILNFTRRWSFQSLFNLSEKYRITHKGWDCKDDPKSQNIMIWSLIFGSAFNRVFWCFTKWLSTKIDKEPWMQGNGLNKFLTIVFS